MESGEAVRAAREEHRRGQATGESPRHQFLKNVGSAFLYNQGCYLVDMEVKLNHMGLKRFHELDNHTVIDVC